MDAAVFYTLVAQMRKAQKEFFKSRTKSNLDAALVLEKQVDKALKEVMGTDFSRAPDRSEQMGFPND